jgi:general secretion pathway protein K
VLVLVVVTAAAVLKFSERALGEMAGEGYYMQRERLRGEAYSALEATLAVLAQFREIDGGLYAPAQGWGDPLALSGYEPAEGRTVSVEFADENAKLPLTNAEWSEPALAALFTDLGFEPGEVNVLTDSLLDWIDADDNPRPYGAEKDDYLRGDPPHVAANRALRSFAELAAVQGFADLMFTESGRPNERCERFMRRVSLWSDGTINLNTASDELLRASGLVDDRQLASLVRALDTVDGDRGTAGARFYRSLNELGDQVGAIPGGGMFGVQTEVLGIVVTVRERQAEFRLKAVIRTDSTGTTRRSGTGDRRSAQNAAGGGNTAIGTAAGRVGGVNASIEYPFKFLELVEDPPPSSIPTSQTTP